MKSKSEKSRSDAMVLVEGDCFGVAVTLPDLPGRRIGWRCWSLWFKTLKIRRGWLSESLAGGPQDKV